MSWGLDDMKRLLAVAALLVLPSLTLSKPLPADPWQPLQFLMGEWTAEGSGDPGQGSGNFSFRYDLDRKILIRLNSSDYPATKDHPAFSHGDLMVIYPDTKQNGLRAIYFDNEGHVIEYQVYVRAEGTVEMVSDAEQGSPRFRLTYTKTDNGGLAVKFEIAPPDHPEAFRTYLEGRARPKGQTRN
jgi:hypothetical protein